MNNSNVAHPVLVVMGRGPLDPGTPVVRADDPGLTRGDGCFEGIRVNHGVAELLAEHLDRMTDSAHALGLRFEREAWEDLVAQALDRWPDDAEASMRLILTRGPAGGEPTRLAYINSLTDFQLRTRVAGSRVVTLNRGYGAGAFAGRPWLLGGVKTLSYAINMAADREAVARDADDVIFVDDGGNLLESPTAAVVWTDDERTLHTVAVGDNGILASVTQRALFAAAEREGWRVDAVGAGVGALHAATACWLVSAGRGPIEVVELDGQPRDRQPGLHAEVCRLAGFAD